MKKILLRVLLIILTFGILTAAMIAAVNIHMVSYAGKYIYNHTENIPEAEKSHRTAVVLGAYVYDDGWPCPMLEDRLDTGITAYESGVSEIILLTGDHGTRGYDEVNSMKDFVFGKGLPKEDVFLDHAGFSTYDSMIRAGEIFNIEEAVVCTQEYHLTRAVYIARKAGINAYGLRADLRRYPRSEMARYLVREWLARFKDFVLVNILKPDPVYLGEPIPVSGSSQPSYDKPEDIVK